MTNYSVKLYYHFFLLQDRKNSVNDFLGAPVMSKEKEKKEEAETQINRILASCLTWGEHFSLREGDSDIEITTHNLNYNIFDRTRFIVLALRPRDSKQTRHDTT